MMKCPLRLRRGTRAIVVAALCTVATVANSQSDLRSKLTTELARKGVAVNVQRLLSSSSPEVLKEARDRAGNPGNPAIPDVRGLIVGFRPGTEVHAALDAVARSISFPLVYERAMVTGRHVVRFAAPLPFGEAQRIAESVATHAAVADVALDSHVPAQASTDPLAATQLNMKGPYSGTGLGGIDAWSVWPYTTGTSYPVVAVVDSGVLPHPEVLNRVLTGYDFVSDPARSGDGSGRDVDAEDPGDWVVANFCGTGASAQNSSWHGTHVAGVIAADGRNGQGIAGVNWHARILPVRVLGKCYGVASDIIDGMAWAAGLTVPNAPRNSTPAHILNLSLGGYAPTGCPAAYQDVINQIISQGILVVVAVGNNSDDAMLYVPANCQGVLRVYAVDPFGGRASYSNYSFGDGIAAPGGDLSRYGSGYGIRSTVGSGTTTRGSPTYVEMQGTSMAAPHVSGVASLMLSINNNLSGAELAAIMQLSAQPFASTSICNAGICGSGIVNAFLSASYAAALTDRVLVYEFYNSGADHFFRTANRAEASVVNRGSAGPGWYETLDYFYAWSVQVSGTHPVCRFYSPRANSHFFTANQAECDLVKRNRDWNYEGIAFYARIPVGGVCPPDHFPVYRAYNNRHAMNDQNHRFTTDPSIYQFMLSRGWKAEGVVLCV